MKRTYEELEPDVVRFNAEDVIATSATDCRELCEEDSSPCERVDDICDDKRVLS